MLLQRMLVPLDGSARAECVLPHAAALGRLLDAELDLLRVVEGGPMESPGVVDSLAWRAAQSAAGAYLNAAAARLARVGVEARTHVAEGRVAEEIIHFAQRHGTDLVVLSTHGFGEAIGFAVGGTARKVIERVGVSLLLVPGHEVAEQSLPEVAAYRRILTPLDGSPRAEWAASVGATLARAAAGELVLAHVVAVPDVTMVEGQSDASDHAAGLLQTNRDAAFHYLEGLAHRLSDDHERVRTRIEAHPQPAHALSRLIEEEQPDLVVLCAHGTSGDARQSHGSVCSALLPQRTTAVLVLQDMARTTAPGEMEAVLAAPS